MTLRRPVKDLLESPIDASSLARIRAGVATRERAPRRRVAPVLLMIAAAAIGLALLRTRPASLVPVTEGGAGLVAMDTEVARTVSFDDGSTLSLDANTSLAPRTNDGRELVLELTRGTVELDVRPGTGRRWMIDAPWATVEVVGTRFVVALDDHGMDVSVQRGEVVVRGERVPGRERHLFAGQSLRVDAPTETATTTARATPVVLETPQTPLPPPSRATRVTAPAPVSDPVADRFAEADEARASGRPGDAATSLRSIVADHSADPRAAVAAFTLARLDLDVLADPAEALAMLIRARGLGVHDAMDEDVEARTVEALARLGRDGEARASAESFLEAHPESPRVADVRRWSGLTE